MIQVAGCYAYYLKKLQTVDSTIIHWTMYQLSNCKIIISWETKSLITTSRVLQEDRLKFLLAPSPSLKFRSNTCDIDILSHCLFYMVISPSLDFRLQSDCCYIGTLLPGSQYHWAGYGQWLWEWYWNTPVGSEAWTLQIKYSDNW